jgi:hypothetical protein
MGPSQEEERKVDRQRGVGGRERERDRKRGRELGRKEGEVWVELGI